MVLLGLLGTTPESRAVNFQWGGAIDSNWQNSSNWGAVFIPPITFVFGPPANGDTATLAAPANDLVTLSANTANLAGLTISNGIDLDNEGFRVVVTNGGTANTSLSGTGTRLIVDPAIGGGDAVFTDRITLSNDGVLQMRGGTVSVDVQAKLDAGTEIQGPGLVRFGNVTTPASEVVLVLDGVAQPLAGQTLTLQSLGAGRLDLDGVFGNSELRSTSTPNSALEIAGPVSDEFNGTITVGASNSVRFTAATPSFVLASGINPGELFLNGGANTATAARLVAPSTATTLAGAISVTGFGRIESNASIPAGATVLLGNATANLALVGNTTFSSGGTFNMGPGTVGFDGSLQTSSDLTLNAGRIDLDGAANNSVITASGIGTKLTVTAGQLNSTGPDENTFFGTINLEEQADLTVNIDGGASPFVLRGTLNMFGDGAAAVYDGSPLHLQAGGLLRAQPVPAPTGAPTITIRSAANIAGGQMQVDAGAALGMFGPTTFTGGAMVHGEGTLFFSLANTVTIAAPQLLDVRTTLQGSSTVQLNSGARLTLGRGLQFGNGGGRIVEASPAATATEVVLEGNGVVSAGQTGRVAVDRFDWDGTSGGDLFSIRANGRLQIDSPNLGETVSYADHLQISTGATAEVNFNSQWKLPGSVSLLAGDALLAGQSVVVASGGLLQGFGVASVVVENSGTVGPGIAPGSGAVGTIAGRLTIDSEFAQHFDGTLHIDLASDVPASGYDILDVTGIAKLGGTLRVSRVGLFEPALGDVFEILTASEVVETFDTVITPSLSGGLGLFVDYEPTTVSLRTTYLADFDEDGDVDHDDLERWNDGFGTAGGSTHAMGDADNDGDTDGRDWLIWQQQLGWGTSPPLAAVPEPTSMWPFVLVTAAACRSRRKSTWA
jgi:hypothetical protein